MRATLGGYLLIAAFLALALPSLGLVWSPNHDAAANLLEARQTDWPAWPEAKNPGVVWVLGALWRLGGEQLMALRLAMLAVAAATVWLVLLSLEQATGSRWAAAAGASAFAFSPVFVTAATGTDSAPLFACMAWLGIYLSLKPRPACALAPLMASALMRKDALALVAALSARLAIERRLAALAATALGGLACLGLAMWSSRHSYADPTLSMSRDLVGGIRALLGDTLQWQLWPFILRLPGAADPWGGSAGGGWGAAAWALLRWLNVLVVALGLAAIMWRTLAAARRCEPPPPSLVPVLFWLLSVGLLLLSRFHYHRYYIASAPGAFVCYLAGWRILLGVLGQGVPIELARAAGIGLVALSAASGALTAFVPPRYPFYNFNLNPDTVSELEALVVISREAGGLLGPDDVVVTHQPWAVMTHLGRGVNWIEPGLVDPYLSDPGRELVVWYARRSPPADRAGLVYYVFADDSAAFAELLERHEPRMALLAVAPGVRLYRFRPGEKDAR